jgi:glucose/arabinose dehydrogenase
MNWRTTQRAAFTTTAAAFLVVLAGHAGIMRADSIPVTMVDPALQATVVLGSGVSQPMGIVFIGDDDFLVLEKASGQIKRVTGGVLQPTPVLDLAVNSNSERGLLSMVLDPGFPAAPYAYIRWTESSTGADDTAVANVPLNGNRVDRFVWDGSTLAFDRTLIRLRSRQTDNIELAGHPNTANAN